MDWWTLRLLKWISLGVLILGLAIVFASCERRRRLDALYRLALPGFTGAWSAGWLLLTESSRSPTSPWILASLLASFCALHIAFVVAHKTEFATASPALAWGLLGFTAACMVFREKESVWLAANTTAIGTFSLAMVARRKFRFESGKEERQMAMYFGLVAWLEGASLLFMLCVSMPLRIFFGIDIDGESAFVGWVHGVLTLIYWQSAFSTWKGLNLRFSTLPALLIAAFVPFGTLLGIRFLIPRQVGS